MTRREARPTPTGTRSAKDGRGQPTSRRIADDIAPRRRNPSRPLGIANPPQRHPQDCAYGVPGAGAEPIATGNEQVRAQLATGITAHAMWFHRPFRADEWFLYQQESPIATGARGLARGQIYDREGKLLVSVMQEGLFRKIGS
ncbi:acyl-CoA thioesterase domain-containing protein [Actinacidiphila oryziradicis]|uniref:acyl-CoA thioesterase domain-containing protein n=1 Tax=Actinacidiphila oryziradicis TaxID=2571141 RepID=UPI0022454DDA|nr:acyl-CoA thioesterase domain-containing protein [Actinacidiphila oryziradicis]